MAKTESHRLSLNHYMAPDMSLDEVLRWARIHNVEGIGLQVPTVKELGPKAVALALRREGRTPSSLSVVLGLTDPDPEAADAKYAAGLDAINLACDLDSPLVVLPGGVAAGRDWRAAHDAARGALETFAGRARSLGVQLLVEVVHPALVEHSTFTNLRDTLAVADSLQLGIVLDTWHSWQDPTLNDLLDAGVGPMLHVVQLADWAAGGLDVEHREVPGSGVIDLHSLCSAIANSGFVGWWEIESYSRRRRTVISTLERLEGAVRSSRLLVAAAMGLTT